MTKQEKIVVEGEVITDSSLAGSAKYQQYTQRPTDSALVGVWAFSLLAVFLSFIPIFGLIVCVIAFGLCLLKKTPPILPILGIIIGSVTTALFLLLWFVLKVIFIVV